MKAILLAKQEEVALAAKRFAEAKVVIAFDYQGLTVSKSEQLRKALRQSGCEMAVLKNNITRRASVEAGYAEFAEALKGPKAIIFSNDDVVAPAKALYEFSKENEVVKIAGGIVEGQVVDTAKILELAALPSYETLLTMLAAGMLGTVSQLAIGLNMIVEQREEQENA